MKHLKRFENMESRDSMCDYLNTKCGYDMTELESMSDSELKDCYEKECGMNEEKKDKWIQDAIKKPGSLRKELKKKEGEKITKSEINKELNKLKKKDKDPDKKGVQGLSKSDLKKFKKLNLAKTLKGMNEGHSDTDNYMFFANLENICKMAKEILEMDKSKIDEMLTQGHDWATDHISASKESIEHVHDWLNSHSAENVEFHEGDIETEKNIKGFNNFEN